MPCGANRLQRIPLKSDTETHDTLELNPQAVDVDVPVLGTLNRQHEIKQHTYSKFRNDNKHTNAQCR
jgi:hypothetical protein